MQKLDEARMDSQPLDLRFRRLASRTIDFCCLSPPDCDDLLCSPGNLMQEDPAKIRGLVTLC